MPTAYVDVVTVPVIEAPSADSPPRGICGATYEVRTDAATRSFRMLFSTEGRFSGVLVQSRPPPLCGHRL